MEKHWLKREGADRLVVFALGWAADHAAVEHIALPGCDVLCLYDYRDIHGFPAGEFDAYHEKYLFAWSFGVLVAEHLLVDMDFRRGVAFNGTPRPLDDEFGIGQRRFDVTRKGLLRNGMKEFERRVYGNSYDRLKDRLSPRGLAANIDELTALEKLSYAPECASIRWDRAVVGEYDAIFPPQNMIAYWQERTDFLPLPHYPFADADIILREIDN